MLNLLRLFSRKKHIDDAATAYIEGSATERDEAAIAERFAVNPGLKRDLDSIRDTVALLRSIEPVKAPRSFLLQEAPVRIRRTSRPRMATIPAVFAIAAAVMVGLLAVGNLTDVIHQSNGTGANSESAMFAKMADDKSGAAGSAASQDTEALAPTGSVAASAGNGVDITPLPTPGPMPTATTAGLAVSQPDASGGSAEGSGSALAPSIDATAPDETSKTLELPVTTVDDGTDMATSLPLPAATIPAATGQLPTFEPTSEKSGDGFGVPLWQLQVGFAVFAVLMAGAWMILQRRLTR
ncbi:MAG: hypothetical protein O2788_03470 [Chloroflexi bacterium]|nr:hypothetical protein [Chloroflexota bacterium]